MSEPTMRSRPDKDCAGGFYSVSAADIIAQDEAGWPDFGPEHFCHRCGCTNVSWYTIAKTWNDAMRGGDSFGWGDWQEIICIPCFIEIAEAGLGPCAWRVTREPHGTEALTLLGALP